MKKAVALIITFGVVVVISFLAIGVTSLMRSQALIAEHHIKRRYRFLAAQAGLVHAYEMLRKGEYDTGNHALEGGIGEGRERYAVHICVLNPGDTSDDHCSHVSCPNDAPSDYCIHAHAFHWPE